MSILFSEKSIGNLTIKNRFVHSATYESMASENGEVGDNLIRRYRNLAKGETGLIIPGYCYVHPLGKAASKQIGVHSDDMTPGLAKMTKAVHQEGGKIIFQLMHAGRQTTKALIGQTPLGPSGKGRDPMNMVKPKEMNEEEIEVVIEAFAQAGRRVAEAGADGVQLHAAHGYLLNQFLSPFFNHRKDDWGGSEEKRFRLLKKIISPLRKALPKHMPLLVKLNSNDHTPKPGIVPSLAVKYAERLDGLIDALEISAGTTNYSFMNMCRGETPVEELVNALSWWKKPLAKFMFKRMVGKYDLLEPYNQKTVGMIKDAGGQIPMITVGGIRSVAEMERLLENKRTDFISMSRPFVREPFLASKIRRGKKYRVSCVSCNKCLAAVAAGAPLRCYSKT